MSPGVSILTNSLLQGISNPHNFKDITLIRGFRVPTIFISFDFVNEYECPKPARRRQPRKGELK